MATVEETKMSSTTSSTRDSDEDESVGQRNSENKIINLDKRYLKTVDGILRLLTSVFSLAAFICEEQVPDCWKTDTTCLTSLFKHYSTYRYFGIITFLIFLSSASLFFFKFTRFSLLKKVTPLFSLVTNVLYLGITIILLFFADMFLFIQMSGFVAHRYAAILGLFTLGSLVLQLVHELIKLNAIKRDAQDLEHAENLEHEDYDQTDEAWALDHQSETQSTDVPKLSFIRPRSSSVDSKIGPDVVSDEQTNRLDRSSSADSKIGPDMISNEQTNQFNLNSHENRDYEEVFLGKETNTNSSSEDSNSHSSLEEKQGFWVVSGES
ncbi:uncharacterized protein LOC143258708 isoform X1 [Tachypleus tridentatus]|uniref:uncharacterized protein LOC143258708 isoform X1 n=1 Tax=Tachypleus tridentatus TaxID=6853 RepID=UPI003FD473B7